MDVGYLVQCDVDRFYGIEYEEFPAQIAQVAMWLIDHQMNQLVSNTFGNYYVRLPLRKSATIVHGNALRTDWQSLIDPLPWEKGQPKYDYILGNPPFKGGKWMNEAQREDMKLVFQNHPNYGLLDYVTAWYIKAAKYMKEYNFMDQAEDASIEQPLRTLVHDNNGPLTKTAFVSTNSITQGEQVSPLWSYLLSKHLSISFAYRTFVWINEAKGNAAVHCVIIGLSSKNEPYKRIFFEENKTVSEVKADNINPYLVDAKNVLIPNRSKPICNVPEIATGNKPVDDGNYIFTELEMIEFIKSEPKAEKFIFPFWGAEEFINNKKRFILYLRDITPNELHDLPKVVERIN